MSHIPQNIESRLKDSDVNILLGLAEGLTMNEIGDSLARKATSRQIESRVFWLRKIFEARTAAQLVASAYHYGILRVPYGRGESYTHNANLYDPGTNGSNCQSH